MNIKVCTLFEGRYHYGVAVLTNSLYKWGFRGEIHVGYRGNLPNWTSSREENKSIDWGGVSTFEVLDGLTLNFLPLETDISLTNYKPNFMMDLLENETTTADGLLYFDPDIVNVTPINFFAEWIEYGIAMAADVNSPISRNHPRRMKWVEFYSKYSIDLNYESDIYVNGGFIGVAKKDIIFLNLWKKSQELMANEIGGLHKSIFSEKPKVVYGGDFDAFSKTDQDALNVAMGIYGGKTCIVDRDAMGFSPGLEMFPHALGRQKPWDVKPLLFWLKGLKPRRVDKLFWEYAEGPIKPYNKFMVYQKQILIKVWSVLIRFYSKQ